MPSAPLLRRKHAVKCQPQPAAHSEEAPANEAAAARKVAAGATVEEAAAIRRGAKAAAVARKAVAAAQKTTEEAATLQTTQQAVAAQNSSEESAAIRKASNEAAVTRQAAAVEPKTEQAPAARKGADRSSSSTLKKGFLKSTASKPKVSAQRQAPAPKPKSPLQQLQAPVSMAAMMKQLSPASTETESPEAMAAMMKQMAAFLPEDMRRAAESFSVEDVTQVLKLEKPAAADEAAYAGVNATSPEHKHERSGGSIGGPVGSAAVASAAIGGYTAAAREAEQQSNARIRDASEGVVAVAEQWCDDCCQCSAGCGSSWSPSLAHGDSGWQTGGGDRRYVLARDHVHTAVWYN